MLGAIADLTWRRPRLVLAAAFLLAAGAGIFARSVEDHLQAAGFTDSASESERATALLREELGYNPNPAILVVVRDPGGGPLDVGQRETRSEIRRLTKAVAGAEYVARATGPFTPGREGASLRAADGDSVVIAAQLGIQDLEEDGGRAAEAVDEAVGESPLDVAIGGYAPSFNEVNDQTREDLTKAELIAFPILAILLLIVFRGVVAAAIPLLIGGLSIVGTFLVLRVMSEVVDTSVFALNIGTGLSLGLAVDYALLLVSRYREELATHGATREAHRRTVTTAGRTVLFSGFTVAVAMLPLVALPQRFLYSLGVAGAAVGILSALTAVLVVSSILAIAGERIDALSVRRGPPVSATSGGWYRLARGVMRRPVLVALASAAAMLAVAAPLLSATLTGPSAEAVPPGVPSYDANEYLEGHYPRRLSEAVTVTVTGGSPDALERLRGRVTEIEGIGDVDPFTPVSHQVAFANLGLDGPALSGASQDAVREIRDLGVPGGEVLVSGNSAAFIDLKESLVDHLPLLAALVAAATFVLLFLLTGSIVLPLKTLVMNALTLAATLGVLTIAFEDGLLSGLFDYTGPEAIETVSLVFLFAVIFGLATDYAVLVMARIKEHHDSGLSNEEAVAHGIARTGRVITAAAVMIAVVFLAFAVSPVFFMKQIALGMAIGVIVDATVVRALLVPSLMRLFGEFNWWAPRPLRRFQARFGVRETG